MRRLTPPQRDLAAANVGLARLVCVRTFRGRRRLAAGAADLDDAVGDALLALCRAAAAFRPDLGFRFGTYAGRAVAHAASNLGRGPRHRAWAPLPAGGHDPADPAPGPEESAAELDRAESARRAVALLLSRLSGPQREAVELVYLRGVAQADAAASLGVTRQAINNRLREALRRMRRLARPLSVTPEEFTP